MIGGQVLAVEISELRRMVYRSVAADAVQRDEQMILVPIWPVLVFAQLMGALVGQTVLVRSIFRCQQQIVVLVVLPASVAVESFWIEEEKVN